MRRSRKSMEAKTRQNRGVNKSGKTCTMDTSRTGQAEKNRDDKRREKQTTEESTEQQTKDSNGLG